MSQARKRGRKTEKSLFPQCKIQDLNPIFTLQTIQGNSINIL